MDLPPSEEPSEGTESLSQADQKARRRKRILIGVATFAVVALLFFAIRGSGGDDTRSREAESSQFNDLLDGEAKVFARNPGLIPNRQSQDAGKEDSAAPSSANGNQKQGSGTDRSRAASEKPQALSKIDFDRIKVNVCYELDCQVRAQKGFPSYNKIKLENLDRWFSRDEYFTAVRCVKKQNGLDMRVARVKADLAEYAKLKKKSSMEKLQLVELRNKIMKDWLSLPVIPPRMSLRQSQQGVLGTLSARDEVMEIVSVNKDGSILVKNTASMPYSRTTPDEGRYWITGIKASKLAEGQRYRPQAVFMCAGNASFTPDDGKQQNVKKFETIEFEALTKGAILNSSLLAKP